MKHRADSWKKNLAPIEAKAPISKRIGFFSHTQGCDSGIDANVNTDRTSAARSSPGT
jgi:hypothetical protein